MSAGSISFTLIFSALAGVYIFFVYKLSAKAEFYSRDLNVTIAGMPVIVAAIMIAMQSNLIVSLGMVGALSIVRFRNAVKNPLDLLYLFWAISAGIITGVGLKVLALALCVMMTALLLALQMVPNLRPSTILVIRMMGADVEWRKLEDTVKRFSKRAKERSRSLQRNEIEVIFTLDAPTDSLLDELKKFEGIKQINMLSHDGEYRI